jgi:hypothetical protein
MTYNVNRLCNLKWNYKWWNKLLHQTQSPWTVEYITTFKSSKYGRQSVFMKKKSDLKH